MVLVSLSADLMMCAASADRLVGHLMPRRIRAGKWRLALSRRAEWRLFLSPRFPEEMIKNALLRALREHPNTLVREACAERLRNFENDLTVATRMLDAVQHDGDTRVRRNAEFYFLFWSAPMTSDFRDRFLHKWDLAINGKGPEEARLLHDIRDHVLKLRDGG